MDNGFMSYIQLFIDFILKLIALFKSNDNTESNKKDWFEAVAFCTDQKPKPKIKAIIYKKRYVCSDVNYSF